ncbi:MAG: endonuclease domain-containing protein [Acidimicrobiia bacterium]|nr:endonuclease domain-containing protein [Acidimicrobiia bacterium]
MTATERSAFDPTTVEAFHYVGLDVRRNRHSLTLRCRYALDKLGFEEQIDILVPPHDSPADDTAIGAAARLVYLLAGVSYFKAAAPLVIEVPDGLNPSERELVSANYHHGLGEYAFRNQIDLSRLSIEAPDARAVPLTAPTGERGPLVAFGGGIDSIVTVEGLRRHTDDLALLVVSRSGDRFEAIERAAAETGLPVLRGERALDPKILRSSELGFRNGHVPITGILSAVAVLTALVAGRDSVVMSNESSASSGNVEWNGQIVNHQWSKTLEFEDLFRAAIRSSIPGAPDYFSWLRSRSELWVAESFARLDRYHPVFRSCNRAFHQDPAHRLDRWCGQCDKCAFVDLILSPFVEAATLRSIFDGREPLDDPAQEHRFLTLLGLTPDAKPFECVGDVDECRAAVVLAAQRDDRAGSVLLGRLAAEASTRQADVDPNRLLAPLGPHRVPARYAPPDLLV